jgi:peptidoglycan/LPS O-acetylase OafA/YrhL
MYLKASLGGGIIWRHDDELSAANQCPAEPVARRTQRNMVVREDEWAFLGCVRFVLAVIVVAFLVKWLLPLPPRLRSIGLLGPEAALLGFFLISGFSIAHSVTTRPTGFYRRRLDRIYPVYLVGIVLALIPFGLYGLHFSVNGNAIDAPKHGIDVLWNTLMLQGWACERFDTNSPLRSSGPEVTYYGLAPLFARSRWRC